MYATMRILAFPVLLANAIGLALWLGTHGRPWAEAVVAGQTVGLATIAVAERLLPFRPAWNRSHGDLGTDVVHAVVSGVLASQLAAMIARLAVVVAAGELSAALAATPWPRHWPLLAQLALALAVAELFQYWLHRLQHEHDLLWRFHAVHHSAPRLYWLNAARFHPVDLGLLYLVGYLPLAMLGCPPAVIALFGLFDAVFGMLQHANLNVRLGPLNWLFSMAEPHRWHHSRVLAEANANYGSNLIVWDHVFGTFFLPTRRTAPERIGIADLPRFPTSYLAQLAAPFRWQRVRAESAPAGAGLEEVSRTARAGR